MFRVGISLSSFDSKLTKKQKFNQSLKKATDIILVRLTAQIDIQNQDGASEFLKTPSAWLESFHYKSIDREGVSVGNEIVFIFNKKLIYRYFKEKNFVIWPIKKRPTTLVYGVQKKDDLLISVNKETIQNLPTLDFRWLASKFALPILISKSTELDILPSTTVSNDKIISLLRNTTADYLLNFEAEVLSSNQKSFVWKLYNINGEEVLISDRVKGNQYRNLENVFETLLEFYSQSYRDNASYLNSIELVFLDVEGFDQFNLIETKLQELDSLINKIEFISMSDGKIVFKVTFQGGYDEFKQKIVNDESLQVIFESTDKLELIWRPV